MKPRIFQIKDYVLRKVIQNINEYNTGKFGRNLEGQYQIKEMVPPGAYIVHDME